MFFLGYALKRVVARPEWLKAANVTAICSVSNCTDERPTKLDRWTFNGSGFYDTIAAAMEPIAPERQHEYAVFAYHLLNRRFVEGEGAPFPEPGWLAKVTPEPMPRDFKALGFDCVSGEVGLPGPYETGQPVFGHSPLSCNSMAEQIATNKWCLIDTRAEAERHAAYFSTEVSHVEPGDYYVVGVWSQGEPVINAPG
jgi:hypothetical protein